MIETADQVRLREALERLVQLYDATERRAKADEWRQRPEETKPAKSMVQP
jgi:hypothetical protein